MSTTKVSSCSIVVNGITLFVRSLYHTKVSYSGERSEAGSVGVASKSVKSGTATEACRGNGGASGGTPSLLCSDCATKALAPVSAH
jgi:hypothetical protein